MHQGPINRGPGARSRQETSHNPLRLPDEEWESSPWGFAATLPIATVDELKAYVQGCCAHFAVEKLNPYQGDDSANYLRAIAMYPDTLSPDDFDIVMCAAGEWVLPFPLEEAPLPQLAMRFLYLAEERALALSRGAESFHPKIDDFFNCLRDCLFHHILLCRANGFLRMDDPFDEVQGLLIRWAAQFPELGSRVQWALHDWEAGSQGTDCVEEIVRNRLLNASDPICYIRGPEFLAQIRAFHERISEFVDVIRPKKGPESTWFQADTELVRLFGQGDAAVCLDDLLIGTRSRTIEPALYLLRHVLSHFETLHLAWHAECGWTAALSGILEQQGRRVYADTLGSLINDYLASNGGLSPKAFFGITGDCQSELFPALSALRKFREAMRGRLSVDARDFGAAHGIHMTVNGASPETCHFAGFCNARFQLPTDIEDACDHNTKALKAAVRECAEQYGTGTHGLCALPKEMLAALERVALPSRVDEAVLGGAVEFFRPFGITPYALRIFNAQREDDGGDESYSLDPNLVMSGKGPIA